jgi:hypothetical protein
MNVRTIDKFGKRAEPAKIVYSPASVRACKEREGAPWHPVILMILSSLASVPSWFHTA